LSGRDRLARAAFDDERFPRTLLFSDGAHRAAAAVGRLQIVTAVARAERNAIAIQRRAAVDRGQRERFPQARHASIGEDSAAATTFGDEIVRAVARAQVDPGHERRHERPLGLEPRLELRAKRRAAKVEAEIRVEAPRRGAGALGVRVRLPEVVGAIGRRVWKARRLLEVDRSPIPSQRVDDRLDLAGGVPASNPRIVIRRHVEAGVAREL